MTDLNYESFFFLQRLSSNNVRRWSVRKSLSKPNNKIKIDTLPESLRDFAEKIDQNGDGFIDESELLVLFQDEVQTKLMIKHLRWLVIFLSVVLIVSICALTGITWAIVNLSKDTTVSSNGQMFSKATGQAIQTQNSEFCSNIDGQLVRRHSDGSCDQSGSSDKTNHISTAKVVALHSGISGITPAGVLSTLERVTFDIPTTNKTYNFLIQGFSTSTCSLDYVSSICEPTVTIYTSDCSLDFIGDSNSPSINDISPRLEADFISNRRRLQSNIKGSQVSGTGAATTCIQFQMCMLGK